MLKNALEFLGSEEMKANECHLNVSNCKVWWPVAPTEQLLNYYLSELSQIPTER